MEAKEDVRHGGREIDLMRNDLDRQIKTTNEKIKTITEQIAPINEEIETTNQQIAPINEEIKTTKEQINTIQMELAAQRLDQEHTTSNELETMRKRNEIQDLKIKIKDLEIKKGNLEKEALRLDNKKGNLEKEVLHLESKIKDLIGKLTWKDWIASPLPDVMNHDFVRVTRSQGGYDAHTCREARRWEDFAAQVLEHVRSSESKELKSSGDFDSLAGTGGSNDASVSQCFTDLILAFRKYKPFESFTCIKELTGRTPEST